uniref:NADH-ubiquinone oxidoreductase chain 2 n=1 Tax=Geocapromys ingrahami TaxID=1543403 RepID=A0A6H0DRC6_9HYST|nr:NADH dehydrogenase subunit 2 [Geocapromys ingrahami]QIS91890.1 NADH dehydrogenase subunit 2 [Geocapromys ingrahami]QIS91916.1 NADH dehydrogenase subunit 2 [Geocapromys ingrahami]
MISTTVIYTTLILGTLITLISSHWFLMWMGLEMSMLSIIPILTSKSNPRSTEAATKYFLTQATASMIFLLSIVMTMMYSGQWSILHTNNQIVSSILTLALIMKLGLAPFHFWVPEVTQGSSLIAGMILLTWQKIAPLSILTQISPVINQTMIISSALLSTLLGGWGGLNQTQLRKILAYSSIAHMGWMLVVMNFNPSISLFNLMIYIIMTISLFATLHMNNNLSTLSLSNVWSTAPPAIIIILLTLLSMGGLPPLTGFSPKWIIIQELVKNNNIVIPTLMTIMALLNLYFYVRLTYSTTLTLFPSTNNTKIKWYFNNSKKMIIIPPLMTLSIMSLPLTPLFISLS